MSTRAFLSPAREALLVFAISMCIIPVVVILSFTGNLGLVQSNLYFYGTATEFILVGFFAVLFATYDGDRRGFYGLSLNGAVKSVLLGILLVGLRAVFRFFSGSAPFQLQLVALTQSLALPFPQNLFFAAFTGFSYGPLEVFYITFLVAKLDLALSPSGRVFTKGMVLGVLLWALLHLNNFVFYGLELAAVQVATNFIYGILIMAIFKYSKCSLGPMLSFTVTNLAQ